jgi:NAD(P)H-hydrate epimerase
VKPLPTADEVRRAEQAYPGYPDSMAELMEHAGTAVAERALAAFADARSFAVVCGKGSNGGDGRVAARVLGGQGREARIVEAAGEEAPDLGEPDVIVDALFGTGFSGEPRPEAARVIEAINASPAPVVAVDVPSGVDSSTGEVVGAAVRAEVTVTFQWRKLGLVVAPGRFHAGTVHVADIGLREADGIEASALEPPDLLHVPARAPGDSKYTAGAVLVVGGSRGLTGAVCLAAEAALRADAGYVAVAAPASALPILEQRLLEPVKRPCPEDAEGRLTEDAAETILAQAERAGAIALGPGLGRSDGTKALVRRLLAELEKPVVVDADALWQLEPWSGRAPAVLTPHAGELGRLLGKESSWVDAHRLAAVREAAEQFEQVVLLKGADTLVARRGEPLLVSDLGPPALATAGTGDVLTGVVAAFLAKGLPAQRAAAVGAAAHGFAGSLADFPRGLVAGDLLQFLPQAFETAEHWR